MPRLGSVAVVLLAIAPAAAAQDYLIRIEATGYFDSTAAEPKEKPLWSIEAVGKPGAAFSRTLTDKNRTVDLRGQLKLVEKSQFDVHFDHHFSIGEIIEGGTVVSFPRDAGFAGHSLVEIGKRKLFFEHETKSPGKPDKRTKYKLHMIVRKLETT